MALLLKSWKIVLKICCKRCQGACFPEIQGADFGTSPKPGRHRHFFGHFSVAPYGTFHAESLRVSRRFSKPWNAGARWSRSSAELRGLHNVLSRRHDHLFHPTACLFGDHCSGLGASSLVFWDFQGLSFIVGSQRRLNKILLKNSIVPKMDRREDDRCGVFFPSPHGYLWSSCWLFFYIIRGSGRSTWKSCNRSHQNSKPTESGAEGLYSTHCGPYRVGDKEHVSSAGGCRAHGVDREEWLLGGAQAPRIPSSAAPVLLGCWGEDNWAWAPWISGLQRHQFMNRI